MESFISRLDHLIIRTRKRKIRGPLGNMKGIGFGDSFDFYGHSPYVKGDDIRKIDWKAYMRTNKFYIKKYLDERKMNVNIILDSSFSMDYGEPNKWNVAILLAVGLAYIVVNQGDMLKFFTLNDEISFENRANTKDEFHKLITSLKDVTPEGKTDFNSIENLGYLADGITIIISDLFCHDLDKMLDFLCMKGQDVIIIHIMSRQELAPDFSGEYKLLDKETREEIMINMNDRVRSLYKSKVKSFISNLKESCNKRKIRYIFAQTVEDPFNVIAKIAEVK